eukprot:CAMPEP_0176471458 /NCGR_PEP_ID=MMETSP0127-20121128/41140_1 /TAXON_ID=938130 /ORGANISM="Platyophrya macrostoma, Strain WH" /LENGTH=380 /DNA_ID=CAMNT_0017866101 /DNA_START=254 /DNA_END=1396 /DNA_ORIENTATION=+
MPNETVRNAAGFKAPPNVGPGRAAGQEANPWKSWELSSHKWLIFMCGGCLVAGYSAGHMAEVDETKIKPKFDRDSVIADIAKNFEFRPDLAPTSLRVAFVLAARRAGLVAPSVDESCAVVDGLEDIAGVYSFIAGKHPISMEDVAALMAVEAVKFLRGPYDRLDAEWHWGRQDRERAVERVAPRDGQPFHTVPFVMKTIGGKGTELTDEECVALLGGAHSVGEFHEHVSGIERAKHVPNRGFTLNNDYFIFLLDMEKRAKGRGWNGIEVARTDDNKAVRVLPKTMRCVYAPSASAGSSKGGSTTKKEHLCLANARELDAFLKKPEWRVHVETFARDKEAWAAAFQRALSKMLNSGYSKLRPFHVVASPVVDGSTNTPSTP